MATMEDSGIDSEDKQSTVCDDVQRVSSDTLGNEGPAKHMVDLDVVFRGIVTSASSNQPSHTLNENTATAPATTTSSEETSTYASGEVISRQPPPNTCRILQRKLELKVERAKRNYSQHQEENAKKTQSANLIPINRLPIPGDSEHKPLVDYKSDSSDPEEISFFPAKLKTPRSHHIKRELTDTFSIQEMTIDSDLDSDDSAGSSQNLELLPPMAKKGLFERLSCCFNCSNRRNS